MHLLFGLFKSSSLDSEIVVGSKNPIGNLLIHLSAELCLKKF